MLTKKQEYNARAHQDGKRFIALMKLEYGCMDCGYNTDPDALDFDHVLGEKKFGLGDFGTRGIRPLLAEMQKCEVVCANCHRIRTKRRREHLASRN